MRLTRNITFCKEKNMEKKMVNIESLDFYRLLLANLRYCYTRNNHLEPTYAYDRVKEEYLPELFEVDEDVALHTAKQMCDECISDEICMRFWNGEEDENGNRRASFLFIDYLLEEIHKYEPEWLPYNYNQFLRNKALDEEPIYLIYEIKGKRKMLVSDTKYSTNYCIEALLREVLHLSDEELKAGIYYSKERVKNSFVDKRNNKFCQRFDDFIYSIKEPVNRTFYIKNTRNDRFKKVRK